MGTHGSLLFRSHLSEVWLSQQPVQPIMQALLIGFHVCSPIYSPATAPFLRTMGQFVERTHLEKNGRRNSRSPVQHGIGRRIVTVLQVMNGCA